MATVRSLALFSLMFLAIVSAEGHSEEFFRQPLKLRVNVGVILVGFENGSLNTEELSSLLHASLPQRQPMCLQENIPLNTKYEIAYDVSEASTESALLVEEAVSKALRNTGKGKGGIDTVKIEDGVSDVFDALYASHLQSSRLTAPYLVFILNLFHYEPKKSKYAYSYYGSALSQTFIGSGRYVVADLSAGPVSLGKLGHREGTVGRNHPMLPRVELNHDELLNEKALKIQGKEAARPVYEASLASLVVSAIRNVFLGDLKFCNISPADRWVVPIMVFRNHREWTPWQNQVTKQKMGSKEDGSLVCLPADENSGEEECGDKDASKQTPYKIDVALVAEEVKKLIPGEDSVQFITGLHSLHEHKHLSMAIAKGIRHMAFDRPANVKSDEEELKEVVRVRVTLPYLDSSVLFYETQHIADSVIQAVFTSDGSDQKRRRAITSATLGDGVRSVPIIVFSLSDANDALFFDAEEETFQARHNAVFVVQTALEKVPTSFFVESKVIRLSQRAVDQNILAGLLQAVSGILPPYEYYSEESKQVRRDYLWSTGFHPFAPFSKVVGISEIYHDATQRNQILGLLHTISLSCQHVIHRVNDFIAVHLNDPVSGRSLFETEAESREQKIQVNWLEVLVHKAVETGASVLVGKMDEKIPVSRSIQASLARLHQDLMNIEEGVEQATHRLQDRDFQGARVVTLSLTNSISILMESLDVVLDDALLEFECCQIENGSALHERTNGEWWALLQLFVVLLLLMCAFSRKGMVVMRQQVLRLKALWDVNSNDM